MLIHFKAIGGRHQPHVLKAVYMHVTNALFMAEISNPFNSKIPHFFSAHAIVTNKTSNAIKLQGCNFFSNPLGELCRKIAWLITPFACENQYTMYYH